MLCTLGYVDGNKKRLNQKINTVFFFHTICKLKTTGWIILHIPRNRNHIIKREKTHTFKTFSMCQCVKCLRYHLTQLSKSLSCKEKVDFFFKVFTSFVQNISCIFSGLWELRRLYKHSDSYQLGKYFSSGFNYIYLTFSCQTGTYQVFIIRCSIVWLHNYDEFLWFLVGFCNW